MSRFPPRVRVLTLAVLLSACSHKADLPVLGSVPDFFLTDQAGALFHEASLRGHVWIADFIYTNCPGPCPLMSERMHRIQKLTAGDPSIHLVSFTVDPARDTPPVLAKYAHRFAADAKRWVFLTGNPQTLNMLDRDAFKLGTLDPSFTHSTRFVLVDGDGRIRAYYSYGDENMIAHVASDAKALAKENS